MKTTFAPPPAERHQFNTAQRSALSLLANLTDVQLAQVESLVMDLLAQQTNEVINRQYISIIPPLGDLNLAQRSLLSVLGQVAEGEPSRKLAARISEFIVRQVLEDGPTRDGSYSLEDYHGTRDKPHFRTPYP